LSTPEEYTVIIDIGQGSTKVGFAGDIKPRTFPTIVGKPKYQQMMQGMNVQDLYVGEDTMGKMRGVMKLDYPINRGNVMDWNHYYAILNHVFYNVLRVETNKCNIIYLVPPLTPPETAIYFARVLFETHNCKSVVVLDTASAAVFASGETTALSVEIGTGLTHITPVMNGQLYGPSIQRLNLAGWDIEEYLSSLLNQYGMFQKRELVVEIKEKICEIVKNVEAAGKDPNYAKVFLLPDGEKLKVNPYITTYAGEVLFNPQLMGYPMASVPQAIIAALQRVDKYYWRPLLKRIILSGGTTLFKGFKSRLEADVENLLSQLGPLPPPEEEKPKELPKEEPKKEEKVEKEDKPGEKKLVQIKIGEKGAENCSKCGQLITGNDKFCPQCGAEVVVKQIDIIGAERVEYPKKCPECRKELDGLSAFCPYCGNKLNPVVTQDKVERSDKKILKQTAASEKELKKLVEAVEDEYGSTEDLEELEKISKAADEAKKEKEKEVKKEEPVKEIDDPNKVVKVITSENQEFASFKGAAILGSLPSFKQFLVDKTAYNQNPYAVIIDLTRIVNLMEKK
jgi:actin-related protein